MTEDITSKKAMLREEAIRARGLLSLSASEVAQVSGLFFGSIPLTQGIVIAGYWPKDREFDVRPLMEDCISRGYKVVLPLVVKGSKILKFVNWRPSSDMMEGAYGVLHPVLDDHTEFLEPDVFLVPLLAFDRRGGRLGYGGGYYDATLGHYAAQKNILAIGVAYGQQACLFNLPSEAHDVRMDWVITPQQAISF